MQVKTSTRWIMALVVGTLMFSAVPARSDDLITQICEISNEIDPDTGCECVMSAVRDQVGENGFSIVGDVYLTYFRILDEKGRSGAWKEARERVATDRGLPLTEVQQITNPMNDVMVKAHERCNS